MTGTAPAGSERRLSVPVALLRALLFASGLGAWAASGVPAELVAVPTAAAVVAVVAVVGVSAVALARNPGNRVPGVFLLVVITARLVLTPGPLTWPQTLLAVAFVASIVACHSLAGLCAVLPGDGEVAVHALLPGARRLVLVTAVAGVALAIPASTAAIPAAAAPVVLATAAGAVLAVIVLVTSAGRRH